MARRARRAVGAPARRRGCLDAVEAGSHGLPLPHGAGSGRHCWPRCQSGYLVASIMRRCTGLAARIGNSLKIDLASLLRQVCSSAQAWRSGRQMTPAKVAA